MKLLFGLLILINIAFFLWNSSNSGVDEGQRRQSVHEEDVRLASEAGSPGKKASLDDVVARGMPEIKPVMPESAGKETAETPFSENKSAGATGENERKETAGAADSLSRPVEGVATPTAATPAPTKPEAIKSTAKVEEPEPVKAKPIVKKCQTFGPYTKKSAAQKKIYALKKSGEVATISSSTKSAGLKNRYRVYQGSFNTSEMARARRDSLSRKGIKEHFARKNEHGKYIISLGVFSSRETAEKLVASLAKKGEKAQVMVEKIAGESVSQYYVKTSACK